MKSHLTPSSVDDSKSREAEPVRLFRRRWSWLISALSVAFLILFITFSIQKNLLFHFDFSENWL